VNETVLPTVATWLTGCVVISGNGAAVPSTSTSSNRQLPEVLSSGAPVELTQSAPVEALTRRMPKLGLLATPATELKSTVRRLYHRSPPVTSKYSPWTVFVLVVLVAAAMPASPLVFSDGASDQVLPPLVVYSTASLPSPWAVVSRSNWMERLLYPRVLVRNWAPCDAIGAVLLQPLVPTIFHTWLVELVSETAGGGRDIRGVRPGDQGHSDAGWLCRNRLTGRGWYWSRWAGLPRSCRWYQSSRR